MTFYTLLPKETCYMKLPLGLCPFCYFWYTWFPITYKAVWCLSCSYQAQSTMDGYTLIQKTWSFWKANPVAIPKSVLHFISKKNRRNKTPYDDDATPNRFDNPCDLSLLVFMCSGCTLLIRSQVAFFLSCLNVSAQSVHIAIQTGRFGLQCLWMSLTFKQRKTKVYESYASYRLKYIRPYRESIGLTFLQRARSPILSF